VKHQSRAPIVSSPVTYAVENQPAYDVQANDPSSRSVTSDVRLNSAPRA
jgi:hypothetical protein